MTIKEMEARSGVARANIRYYEAEGLLSPQRLSNGYRTYSESDLELLQKIKLLRRLGISIEELRALGRGGAELSAVLERRLRELEGEQASLRRVSQVCGALQADGTTYEALEPEKYLEALDAPAPSAAPPLPASDTLPAEPGLGRRLAARCFDWFFLLSLLITGYALSGRNPSRLMEMGLVLSVGLELLILALDPLLIHLFAATPGKALLGMRITRPGGEKLAYGEAVTRHLWMLWGVWGLWIPIWCWIQLYKCCKRWSDAEPQPWNEGLAYTAQPFRKRHLWRPVLACAAVLALAETVNSASQLPPHRGDLTVADFAENYNRQAAYLHGDVRLLLNAQGEWVELPDPPGTYTISLTESWQEQDIQYTLEGGTLRAVTLVYAAEDAKGWLPVPRETVATVVTALAWARRGTPFWSAGRRPLLEALDQADWENGFTLERDGVAVAWELENRDFHILSGIGVAAPQREGENSLTLRCRIALSPDS